MSLTEQDLAAIGTTREELEAARRRNPVEIDKVKSKKMAEAFLADMEKTKKGKDKAEQNLIMLQQDLTKILKAKVKVYVDDLGSKVFLKQKADNIVSLSSLDWIVNYAAMPMEEFGYFITHKYLVEMVKTWADKAEKISDLPSSFSLSPDEITFNRINIDLQDGPTPTWDQFIQRCGSNGRALMAFTWSLLNKDDQSQQYLFLKGSGGDGKGSYIRWLDGIFNEQLVGLSVTDKWPALCVGRRIGVFNDLNSTSIIMTSQFKQITGKDKVSIEQKYEKTTSVTLDTKFILTTNRSINIINDVAERRRAILVELDPVNDHIDDYENKLKQEGSAFLFKCKLAYNELYDHARRTIKCDYEFFESESAVFEEQYEAIFAKCFILAPSTTCPASDFHSRLVRELGNDNNKVGSFKEWLKRTHGISRIRSSGPRRVSVYKGISIKG